MKFILQTSCKKCVFAKYKKNTQTGCSLQRLEEYKKNGLNIIEGYDEEKEFFIVDGGQCNFYHDAEWAKDKKSLKKEAKKACFIECQAIVIANDNWNDLVLTLKTLVHQHLYSIVVIKPFGCILDSESIINKLKSIKIPHWKLQSVQSNTDTIENSIDIVVDFSPCAYYIVFQAGFSVPPKLIDRLSEDINSFTLTCVALLPNSTNNGFFMITSIHNILLGNSDGLLIDKLKNDEELKNLVLPITDKIKDFPK